jgi:hypothetical protein
VKDRRPHSGRFELIPNMPIILLFSIKLNVK